MTSALPDGRVPMDVLLEEKDEEFLAEWDAADAEALAAMQALLDQVGDRPLPRESLRMVSTRLREVIAKPGWPGQLLIECGGVRPEDLPADDAELWLQLAAGVASPEGSDDWGAPGGGPHETDTAIAAICAIDHFDWLAVITALAAGGPGTAAAATDLAAYVRDYDPGDGDPGDGERGDEDEDEVPDDADFGGDEAGADEDDEFDELGMGDLFLPVTALWRVLGAIDDHERLTPLGWWGLPEAMRIVWAPTT